MITKSFLAPLLVIGFICAYWDVKKSKIPNRIIVAGLLIGLALHLFWFIYGFYYLQNSSYLSYFMAGVLNGIFSIMLGYFLWRFNFWSPGDGKLFGLYGLILPLTLYSEFYIDYFPAFLILINLAFLFLASATFKAGVYLFKERKNIINRITDPSLYTRSNINEVVIKIVNFTINIATAMVVITIISEAGRIILGININAFLIIGFLFLFIHILNKLKMKFSRARYIQHVLLIAYFGRFLVSGDFQGLLTALRIVFIFLLIAGLFKKILLLYIKNNEIKEIRANEVEEGLVLSREWRRYFQEKLKNFTDESGEKVFKKNELSGGLTKKQAAFIRTIFKNDSNYKVQICQSFPFAPYIFLSALILLLTRGSYIENVNDFFMTLTGF